MYCCENCFQNEWLRDCLREDHTHAGECGFCGNKNAKLVSITEITPLLRNAMDVYWPLQYGDHYGAEQDPLDTGDPLITLLQEDWQVFADDLVDSGKANELLEEILNWDWDDDSGESPIDADELYSRRKAIWHSSPAEDWDVFCERVRDKADLEPLFGEALEITIWDHAIEIDLNTRVFRARPNWDRKASKIQKSPYAGHDIEAPPPDKATEGRVNEKGVPVLYVSEKEHTAVAEVRPPRGLLVSVGELRLARKAKILDIGDQIPEPNPFTTEQLSYWIEHADLLNAFSWSLSKPLERTDDLRDYRPSQKISAWLRKQGFDGIRYASAMDEGGCNIVFFNPKAASYVKSSLIQINNVTVDYEIY